MVKSGKYVDFQEIAIIGGTRKKRDLADRVASFAKNKLFPKTERVILDISLVARLTEKEGCMGDCVADQESRECIIRIDSLLEEIEFVTTILHEMVHVKQYLKGELKDKGHFITFWKKQKFDRRTEFAEKPWEVEAYMMEEILTEEFYNG